MALSADGDTALVGETDDVATPGSSIITAGSHPGCERRRTRGSNSNRGAARGGSVSLSADGNTAPINGRGDNPLEWAQSRLLRCEKSTLAGFRAPCCRAWRCSRSEIINSALLRLTTRPGALRIAPESLNCNQKHWESAVDRLFAGMLALRDSDGDLDRPSLHQGQAQTTERVQKRTLPVSREDFP